MHQGILIGSFMKARTAFQDLMSGFISKSCFAVKFLNLRENCQVQENKLEIFRDMF